MHIAYTVYSRKTINGALRKPSCELLDHYLKVFQGCGEELGCGGSNSGAKHINLKMMCHFVLSENSADHIQANPGSQTFTFVPPEFSHYRKETRSNGFN